MICGNVRSRWRWSKLPSQWMTFVAWIAMFDGLWYSRRQVLFLLLLLLLWPLMMMMMMKTNEGGNLLRNWVVEKAMTCSAAGRRAAFLCVQLHGLSKYHCLRTDPLRSLCLCSSSPKLHPDDLEMRFADLDRQQESGTVGAARAMTEMSIVRRFRPSTSSAISRCLDCCPCTNLPSLQMSATGWAQASAVWCAYQRNERTVYWTGTQANRVGHGHYH